MLSAAVIPIRPMPSRPALVRVADRPAAALSTRCESCNLRELCLPSGLKDEELEKVGDLVYTRKRVKRGESVFRAGADFESLYAIRTGFFATSAVTEDGRDQVTGFKMPGEVLGMDGIGTGAHQIDAVALEDSEVCIIPFARLEELSSQLRPLQHHFHRMMSREMAQDQGVMMLLGSMRAEERVAAFLISLSRRFAARGYSGSEFHLRMTREEIGSYLGLKLETVSRVFSKLHESGIAVVHQRHIRIVDAARLKAVMNQGIGEHGR
jgi:CRP/FNR family transcriptional regulator